MVFVACSSRFELGVLEQRRKAVVVWLILNGRVEEALEQLSREYGVNPPRLKIGLPKGKKKRSLGCYSAKDKTISILNSDTLREPFVILHEFYHHLRTTVDLKHRGTEKHANRFAEEFILSYKAMVNETRNK